MTDQIKRDIVARGLVGPLARIPAVFMALAVFVSASRGTLEAGLVAAAACFVRTDNRGWQPIRLILTRSVRAK